ncbi:hypothetical protein AB1395_03975 [Streptococcus pluranimalium]|uniref:hypothetical protein n=1 Tax=Streptococcus pluranimalium TaxID=82348 RepID=UPI0034662ED7
MKQLFQANFEESLNLLDDKMFQYIKRDKKGTMTSTKSAIAYFLFIFGVLLIFIMHYLTNSYIEGELKSMVIEPLPVNLLPIWLFYLNFSSVIMIWVWTKFKRIKILEIEFGSITTNAYLIWLILTLNLFFIFLFGRLLGYILLIIFGTLTSIVVIVGYRKSKERFLRVLYSTEMDKSAFDKILVHCIKILAALIPIFIICNAFYPIDKMIQGSFVELTFIIGSWGMLNCFAIFYECYLMLPYFLSTFYKMKYSENYRIYEGKTKEEW